MKFFYSKLSVIIFITTFSFSGLFAQAVENNSFQYNLRIEGRDQTYFDGKVSSKECTITDSDGKNHSLSNSAACGVVEAAKSADFDYSFQDFGFSLFLTSIGSDNTPADYSKSWGFWLNDDSASLGLDAYSPNQNDSILLTYSGYPAIPLRVTLPNEINEEQPITIKTEKRTGVTDENWVWHGAWEPAVDAKLHINDQVLDVPANGELSLTLSTGKTEIWADGDGLVRSAKSIINIAENLPTPSPSTTPSPAPSPSATPSATPTPKPTSSPNATISSEQRNDKAESALNFLKAKQGDDGAIEGSTVTVWSAIAFGANENRAEEVKKGDKSLLDALANETPESATDLERLIIALRSMGQNPRSFNGHNYVQNLKDKFKNNQFGEESLVNDDIFGVIAMLSADEPANSGLMHSAVESLIEKQANNGTWENIDLTSASIQALTKYRKSDGNINVDDAIDKARTALKNSQDKLGGFGENSATTAWAIQAIISLEEAPSDWKNSSGKDPWTALFSYQNTNGGFGWKTNENPSPFMTAYAIPALLGAPWPIAKLEIKNMIVAVEDYSEPTPSPTASPINKKVSTPAPLISNTKSTQTGYVAGAETSPSPIPEIVDAQEPKVITAKPVAKNNSNKLIWELGFANIGIGMAIASAIGKIRSFV